MPHYLTYLWATWMFLHLKDLFEQKIETFLIYPPNRLEKLTVEGTFCTPFLQEPFLHVFLSSEKAKRGIYGFQKKKNDEHFGFYLLICVIFLEKGEIFAFLVFTFKLSLL